MTHPIAASLKLDYFRNILSLVDAEWSLGVNSGHKCSVSTPHAVLSCERRSKKKQSNWYSNRNANFDKFCNALVLCLCCEFFNRAES